MALEPPDPHTVWTGYELTRQVRRSLRFIWPTSEGHLYREQKRLVTLGWAVVEQEQTGRRARNRYTITQAGREALARWLATPPEEPHLQIEGLLRIFYANLGSPADLHRSMTTTAEQTRSMLATLRGFVGEYLAEGGPMDMLEQGIGGPGQRRTFAGRTMFPERLPSVALTLEITTRLLEEIERFFDVEATTVRKASYQTPRPPGVASKRSWREQKKPEDPTPASSDAGGHPAANLDSPTLRNLVEQVT